MLTDLYSLEHVTISQSDLNRIMGRHEHYLAKQGGVRALLRSAKLDGLVLANRDLSEADLSGVSLVGANLYGTRLAHASLYCADLRDSDLRNAHLEYADLRGASFKGADLAYAVMNYADMRAATMMFVGDKYKVTGNAQNEAPFGAVNFSNCSLRQVSFGNAKLANANFTDALLHGAMFRGAQLENACFRGAILLGVNLAELNVPPEALKDSLTTPSSAAQARAKDLLAMVKAHHEWVVSESKKGNPANIDGGDLRPLGTALKSLSLAGLSACNVVAVSVDFSGCQLQAAKFDGSDLRAASFDDTDLSGVSFDGAKLAHASFRNARIDDFILSNGEVLRARADGAQVVAAQFGKARSRTATFISALSKRSL